MKTNPHSWHVSSGGGGCGRGGDRGRGVLTVPLMALKALLAQIYVRPPESLRFQMVSKSSVGLDYLWYKNEFQTNYLEINIIMKSCWIKVG